MSNLAIEILVLTVVLVNFGAVLTARLFKKGAPTKEVILWEYS